MLAKMKAARPVECVKRPDCPKEGRCHTCTEYQAPPLLDRPLVIFCARPGYRERQTTFFARPWAEAGLWIERVESQKGEPLHGLPDRIAAVGMPDAVVQWDEHGCGMVDPEYRRFISWCWEHEVAPLSLDFGYFDHYSHFMLDLYRPDGSSSIADDWDALPAEVDWNAATPRVRDYRRRVLRGYAEARDKPPLLEGRYVAVYLQQHGKLSRLVPDTINEWMEAVADALARWGLRAAFKTAPGGPEVRCPPGAALFLHGRHGLDLNQRLAVHAAYCLVCSSSITNEFVLADLPVVALGRSWFNGLGVFCEPQSWDELPGNAPGIDREARAKWANWWLRRQFMSVGSGPPLAAMIARFKEAVRG